MDQILRIQDTILRNIIYFCLSSVLIFVRIKHILKNIKYRTKILYYGPRKSIQHVMEEASYTKLNNLSLNRKTFTFGSVSKVRIGVGRNLDTTSRS